MNDSGRERRLKAAQIPARDEDYWEMFPEGVLAKLRAGAGQPALELHALRH
jgi:hypothetical protein